MVVAYVYLQIRTKCHAIGQRTGLVMTTERELVGVDRCAHSARTSASDAVRRDLVDRGFKFVGSTIRYAFMQAVGMVNDHAVDCFRYKQLQ